MRYRTNDDRPSDEFRRAASQCLQLARLASDPSIRTSLLLMAQKWSDLANGRDAKPASTLP
jgi:hypothetical protein